MLSEKNTVLVVIDVQHKLSQVMHDRETLLENLQKIIKGSLALGIPVLWLEQNPSRMGATIPELHDLLGSHQPPISKMSFSGYGEPIFIENLESIGRRQVLLAGIEAHVCVYQTASDLIRRGFEVSVVADAVSSRKSNDRDVGVSRMQSEGVKLTCVEMALFELMRTASHPAFKDILKIVR